MKLYILGNGFDIAHGLNTKYSDYKEFIKENIKAHSEWHIIDDFFPVNHDFWSDAETNICNIDAKQFLELKSLLNTAFLDDLLIQIHVSFKEFITKATDINISKKFELTPDSNYISFNFTNLLEDIYDIKRGHIIYLHNDIKGHILNKYFGLYYPSDLVLGHSPIPNDYIYFKNGTIGNDKEYLEYVKKTTKDYMLNMQSKRMAQFLELHGTEIDEVVIFGFSCSKTDKQYLDYLFKHVKPSVSKYYVYYHVGEKETENYALSKIKQNLAYAVGDISLIKFINDYNVYKI